MIECNEVIKKGFNVDRDSIPHEKQKKIFNKLEKGLLNFIILKKELVLIIFHNLEKAINLNNLTHMYKTEGIIPKDFSNYQHLIDLFKNLRHGNINPKDVLKNQINFKLDLGEIIKRKFKFKIKRSNKCYTKC